MEAIMQLLPAIFGKFRNLILYGIIGTLCAGLDFLVFYTLTASLAMFYLHANILSVNVGITTSFLLNRKYNFKVTDNSMKRFIIFISVGFGGLLLSSALLYFFIDILACGKVISKIVSIVFVVFLQFLLNKYITFKREVL